ncbi:hypothetical protein TL16_g11198 [Triparma laevis f. inornata]|uniref:Kinesin light chain n=1 Tax=Triparma laevis f. inornata TaxID=1714386 RepID=A0A9W7EPX7_9STRA|nr:hypothetical protein TL16_g11198 [Triparma laevis f. inornata]
MRPCGHSMICRVCTSELMTRSEPCTICRKPISSFDVGVYCESLGARGLWSTSYKNLRELASGEGFNEYFRNQYNGNEEPYLRWKEVFDVLEIFGPEKKVRGKKKKKKNDPRKLEILDACAALGKACDNVGDWDEAERYFKRAKEGYEEQLGRDSEKTLNATGSLIIMTFSSYGENIEKLRDLSKRCEKILGKENVVALKTLNALGIRLKNGGRFEEVIKVYERCLMRLTKVLGEDHRRTLDVLNNMGIVYGLLDNYEKALEYFERALKVKERVVGKNHPGTLGLMMNIATAYKKTEDYVEDEVLFERVLEGYEAQFGEDHQDTKDCTRSFSYCLKLSGNSERLAQLMTRYPWLNELDDMKLTIFPLNKK